MSAEPPCLTVCSTTTANTHASPGFTLSLQALSSPHGHFTQDQTAYTAKKVVPYRQRSMVSEGFRRHSTDGTGLGQESAAAGDAGRAFHPYCRQYSEGSTVGCPPLCSSPFACLQELGLADTGNPVSPPATGHEGVQSPWPVHSLTPQASMLMGTPDDPPQYSSETRETYGSISALQQFPDVFTSGEHIQSSHYTYDRLSSKTSQLDTTEMLYPKPIYSYSILIFMALRSSKTGSLPVSEIYSFMTEHFPYFKTAPDGWKNSVRHNLSLNKCFEKVDNKSGNASRKGCLWALNPAKVEKMQEELQKWRRKDPLTIRKSMARPDELDHLLEDKSDKMRSMSARLNHRQTLYPTMRTQSYDTVSPYAPPQPREHKPPQPHRQLLYSYPPSAANQQPPYLSHNPTSFPFQIPVTQQPCTILPPNTGALESPLPAQTPPSYSAALQATRGVSRSMQELLLDGDLGTDVDMLNPSLVDLQLHGHLWEELKDDSLAPDPATTATPTSPCSSLPIPGQRGESLRSLISSGSEEDQEGLFDRSVTTHYFGTFANMDSMSSYQPTGGDASILLM
ncbi:hypothetical protein ACEWY4_008291 [Coilia grayii]|uniref:Fork-head domain-containing protein n=1 Tax=Coilia grayii TaxID=363190 RepID=A0ABD1KAG9_9TELE